MLELYKSPWRAAFQKLLEKTENELVITSPYVKKSEADFICENIISRNLSNRLSFRLLTDLRSQSILDNSLDIDALQLFQTNLPKFKLLTLPRLHAKVYIFDNSYAVVGSANLTPSGFEFNYEYSVGTGDVEIVNKIKIDIDDYSTLGSEVAKDKIEEISIVAKKVQVEYQKVTKSATYSIKKKFKETLKIADIKFSEALVGKKSAYSLYKEAVIYFLSKEPLPTKELQGKIQQVFPDLCKDEELVINGQRFGKAWKHQIRTVLNDLRRKGEIKAINKVWTF